MKQSLQLRLGQQLSMTPQLQQAIRLLQLSTLDLEQEIQQALDSNMMLEVNDDERPPQTEAEPEVASKDQIDQVTSEGSQTDMPDELPIDTTWEDVYETAQASASVSGAETQEYESQRSNSDTLQGHLLWQIELTSFSERDHALATAIIDSVNEDGYVSEPLEEIFQGMQGQLEDLEMDEVVAVLHRLQNFDPPGVVATDLCDCLRRQLLQLPESTKHRSTAIELVTKHLDLLAAHDRNKLLRRLGIDDKQLAETIELIRTLDPKPGNKIQTTYSEYVVPDVFVAKVKGKWQVQLNPDISPKLRINPYYAGLIKRADNSKDNSSMRDHLQEARWFIKSLYSRNETLMRVANCIVEKQPGFLDHGAIAMKPMVLRNVAEELELHESTISRVTTQKYMHTPNGVIEFKYFFSSHVSTEGGGECSATAIRAFIKELISNENEHKPLSDSKISSLLQEKGINVARRTIAKYREAMSISSSSQRKRVL